MPVPVTAPASVGQVQGQRDAGGSWTDYLLNPDVVGGVLSYVPGPLGLIGSGLEAFQPIADTVGGNQSYTSSQSGLFGGGLGGFAGHLINWVTGQLTGDTSGTTNQASSGIGDAPGFFDQHLGGFERFIQNLFSGGGVGSGASAPVGTQVLQTSPAGPQVTTASPNAGGAVQPSATQPSTAAELGQPGTAGYNPNLVAGNLGPTAGLTANLNGISAGFNPGGGSSSPFSVSGGTTGNLDLGGTLSGAQQANKG